MKLKNMFLFSSALMAIAPMSIALAEEANTNDKVDSTNKTETTSDNKTESKTPKEFEGLKIAKDKGPNIAYVSNENLSKEETDKIRDIKKDETIKACSVYKMVYKKTEEPPTPPTPPTTPPETPPTTPPTTPKENPPKPKENPPKPNEGKKIETPKKVEKVIKKVMPNTGAAIVKSGMLIASAGALAGASFYLIKNKKNKTMLVALLVSGGVLYGFINNAEAFTGTEIAPTELIVEGTELKDKEIKGYEYIGVMEFEEDCTPPVTPPEEPPTPPVTPPETPPTPPETPPTPPEEPPKEDPVIRGSVVVHHIWTDGTRAYPSEWVMKDQPIGTEYTTDWHHEDIGVWTKDGQRFKSIKDIFPDEDAYDPNDGYYYAEKAVKDKNLSFFENGISNFIQFHNLPGAYRNNFTCAGDGLPAYPSTDQILDLMAGVKITSQNITESKLPDVMKNKLKNVVTTGGATSEGKLYYSGLDPINEFKYVKVADYSDPVTGTVKEKLQEITYVYDRDSYKVKRPIVVCATDHL